MKNRPRYHIVPGTFLEKGHIPCGHKNKASILNKIISVYIVLGDPMRDTERDHGMPSEDFLAESVDVWQVWAILKAGETTHINDRIKLRLSLTLGIWVKDHSKHEGGEGRRSLRP